jgi:arylsulfatase
MVTSNILKKMKTKYLFSALCFWIACCSVHAQPGTGKTGFSREISAKQPNIIIINMDDMGYGDTEPYGMTGIPTPNFNRAAEEGMRFTHFNVAQAVCSPSRAALLTGCYPNRLGLHHALMPWSDIALNTSEETIASLLKRAEYQTAMFGKWHLGSQPPYLPIHFGFDEFYGIPYSHDMWPVDYDGKPAGPNSNKSRYPPLPILQGDRVVAINKTLEDQAKLTGTFTQKAVDFIAANRSRPFFLYLAQPMPHVPLAASKRFKGKSEMGLLGDVIMELDWSVGEIMNALDKYKLSTNTLLIITSDNGPWLSFGDHAGSSGGLREGKGTAWEGGTRTPCIMRWPGKIKAGSVNSHLLTNMDLLPTIAALTKAPLPANKIDGLDFSNLLLGKASKGPRDIFYYYYDVNSLKAVRYKNWKLVLPHRSQTYMQHIHGSNGYPGPTAQADIKMALYNLAIDPGETYDVQTLYPEIVKKIMLFVEQAREDLGDDLTNRKGRNVRPAAALAKVAD